MMHPQPEFDLVVIGSGSAAFAAAIRARDHSRSVLMVERGTTGGTCVNIGCIPSKTLLADSRRPGTRLADALRRKNDLVGSLRQHKYVDLLERHGIGFRPGEALLKNPHAITIAGGDVTAGAIVIATGARPAVPAIAGLSDAGFLTSTSALELSEAPPRLAVLGGNAVGLELGQMLAGFGSRVTYIVRGARLAPFDEPELSAGIEAVLRDEGQTILSGTRIAAVAAHNDAKVLRGQRDGRRIEVLADEVLVATGRTPDTEGLGLAALGVATDAQGAILVDDRQRTSVPSIYAAGDVTDQPRFVYVAAAAGAAAATNALGLGEESLDLRALPHVTFTTPQIARAGLTEAEAREQGLAVATSVLPLEAVPRALANGDTRGVVKLVAESPSGRLLGASMLADGAGDAIQAAVWAIETGMSVAELGSAWAPYLTMAEGWKLAAQGFERDVADLSCCAA